MLMVGLKELSARTVRNLCYIRAQLLMIIAFVSSITAMSGSSLREIRMSTVDLPLGNEHVPVHKIVDERDYLLEPWSRLLAHLHAIKI